MITADEFKSYIGLTVSDYDSVIEMLISGAVSWIEVMLNNKIKEDSVEEYFDGDEIDDNIYLANNLNLKDLTVEYDSDGSWVAMSDSDYVFYKDQGIVKLDNVRSGELNYKISYKAGFTDQNIPDSLKLAILKLVGKLWNQRKSDGIKTENLGDAGISWEDHLSPDIASILSRYKMYSI
jgi:hypothetical protein